jgi:hypothetical protein
VSASAKDRFVALLGSTTNKERYVKASPRIAAIFDRITGVAATRSVPLPAAGSGASAEATGRPVVAPTLPNPGQVGGQSGGGAAVHPPDPPPATEPSAVPASGSSRAAVTSAAGRGAPATPSAASGLTADPAHNVQESAGSAAHPRTPHPSPTSDAALPADLPAPPDAPRQTSPPGTTSEPSSLTPPRGPYVTHASRQRARARRPHVALLASAASALVATGYGHSASTGSEDDQLSSPTDLAADQATHTLYVLDTGNNAIDRFDPIGVPA